MLGKKRNWMNYIEAAEYLGINESMFHLMVATGSIPHNGSEYYREDLDEVKKTLPVTRTKSTDVERRDKED